MDAALAAWDAGDRAGAADWADEADTAAWGAGFGGGVAGPGGVQGRQESVRTGEDNFQASKDNFGVRGGSFRGLFPGAASEAGRAGANFRGGWEPVALLAAVAFGDGDERRAVMYLGVAVQRASGADRDRLERCDAVWRRHRAAVLLVAEAEAAVSAGQAYRATDRLARACAVLAEPDGSTEAGWGNFQQRRVVAAVSLGAQAAALAYDVSGRVQALEDQIAALAQADPMVADQMDGVWSPGTAVRHRLWSTARALADGDEPDAALEALDQLLRLDPGHAQAVALAQALWEPVGPLPKALAQMWTRARRNDISDVRGSPLHQTPMGSVYAADLDLPVLGQGPTTVRVTASGVASVAKTVPLGRLPTPAAAIRSYQGLIHNCAASLPPGWTRARVSPRWVRLTAPTADVALDLQLLSVAYDRQGPSVVADVVIEAVHLEAGL